MASLRWVSETKWRRCNYAITAGMLKLMQIAQVAVLTTEQCWRSVKLSAL